MDSPNPLLKSPLPHKSPKPRSGVGLEDSPSIPKRRRLDLLHAALNASYPPPFISSPTESPVAGFRTPERRLRDLWDSPDVRSPRADYLDSPDASYLSTPTESPDVGRTGRPRTYKKDELWRAIKPDYQYIMDRQIIETCKSTESDLSWDDDDDQINTKVSFTEFLQQYTELMDWCNQVQMATALGTGGMSLSERYLNQVYREEMLKQSPRKKCLTTYAKQLLRRYPNMKAEINARLQNLNRIWSNLMQVVMPVEDMSSEQMLKDVECDLSELENWLIGVETRLPTTVHPNWTLDDLDNKLREHQALQSEIESHVRIVSAVLKLCERIEKEGTPTSNQSVAVTLERRWHAIWLQSLEWQCRLEYAINQKKGDSRSWDVGYPFQSNALTSLNFDFEHAFDDTAPDSDDEGDILPFSEDEYEKIPVTDTDTQTETGEATATEAADTANEEDDDVKMYRAELSDNALSEVEEVDEAPPTEGKDGGYGSESLSNDEENHLRSESAQTETVLTSSCQVQTQADLDRKLRLEFSSDDGGLLPNMDISASPGEKFYKFTITDSDSERLRSDNEGGAKKICSTPKRRNVPSPRTRLDILLTELEHVVEESSDYFKKDSRLSHLKTNDHEIRTEFAQKSRGGSERIQKLIMKAETLVETKWRRRNRRRTATDSSAATDDSCDASSEFTESEVDYSSAISDTEYVQPCLTSPNQSANTIVNSPQAFVSPVMRPRSDSSRKRERPRSYQEQGNQESVELRTYSISEGALADLREIETNTPKSRRTQSLRSRTRRIKRSRSDSDRLGLSHSSSERTVGHATSGENLGATAAAGDLTDGGLPSDGLGACRSALARMETDQDSDHLNSTVESFSETAWDNYQDPMYASVNDSYLEEKLDDNHLQWEASSNLEFDDDFLHSDKPDRSKRLSLTNRSARGSDDSDSDMEDIKYVLEESRKQLQVADSVLKQRQDDSESGILQPHKYAEVVATCQTNIRCLQDVYDTLQQTDTDLSQDENFLQFRDMIALWRANYDLALERQECGRLLSGLHRSLQSVRLTVNESKHLMDKRTFDSQTELEEYVRELQSQRLSLEERVLEAETIQQSLHTFRTEHPHVCVRQFSQDADTALDECRRTNQIVSARLVELQSSLVFMYDYHETSRELAYYLDQEDSLLQALERQVESPDLGDEKIPVRDDLQTMLDDLHLYEEKLSLLRRLSDDLVSVTPPHQHDAIRQRTQHLANQLASLRKRCHHGLARTRDRGDRGLMQGAGAQCGAPTTMVVKEKKQKTSVGTQTVSKEPERGPRYWLLKKVLKLTLPLQCALLLLYGIMCLGELVISPQLRYVRGPPPF